MLNSQQATSPWFPSTTPTTPPTLSSTTSTTKRNHLNNHNYTQSEEEINHQLSNHSSSGVVLPIFSSETLFVVQNDLYMNGNPTYEMMRVEKKVQHLSNNNFNHHTGMGDSRGNLSNYSLNSPKSFQSHHHLGVAVNESSSVSQRCGAEGGTMNSNSGANQEHQKQHETSRMSTTFSLTHYPNSQKQSSTTKWCSSLMMIKLITSFTSIYILLFIVQGLIGLGTSFMLTHSAGENLLTHSRQYQRLQFQIYINSELERFKTQINSMTNHLAKQLSRLKLNDNLALIKALDSIDTSYKSKVGATSYRWARFDDFYFARHYNDTVDGQIVRVFNPFEQNFKYYNISKESMSKAPSNSKIDIFEYFNESGIVPFEEFYSEYQPKKRGYYLPFDKGNDSSTDIMWSDSWVTFSEEIVITLGIPVFSNCSMSFFSDSNNAHINNSLLHPKYISIPYGQTTKYPHLKHPQYLFGVLSIEFSWESASSTILNASNSGTDILFSNERMEYSIIVDSKYNLVGKKREHSVVTHLYEILKEGNLLSQIGSPCGNVTTNITNSEVTHYGTVFLVVEPGGSYNKVPLKQAIEMEILPICDKYGLDWFVVVGNYRVSFLSEVNSSPEFIFYFLFMFLIQGVFLVFSVANIRLAFSGVRKTAISTLALNNEMVSTASSKNVMVRLWNTFERLTPFVDIREIRANLSTIRTGLTTLSKYVPELVVRAFADRDGPFDKINLAKRDMTIMCTELIGFSEVSNGIHDDYLPSLMNHYFTIVSKAVKEEGGMVMQFLGHRAVSVFNVYCLPLENHEIKACRAALKIMMAIENFNSMHGSELKVSSAIASDKMLCGNTGSQTRMNATVIGSVAHIAKALLFLNRKVGKKILIHEKTYQKVFENFVCNFVDYISFEDFKFPVYSLECIFSLLTEEKEEIHKISYRMEDALSRLDFSTIIQICKEYEQKDETFSRMRKRAELMEIQYSMWNSCDDFDCSFKLRVR